MNKAHIMRDAAHKQIVVERLFEAPREKVWQAWTDSSVLEKWFAPKPWKAVTESFDFSVGGHWHYYMSGPDGEKVWGWVEYLTINPQNSYTALDAFCDETGKKSGDMPSMHWKNEFQDENGTTKVIVTITFSKEEDMNKIIEMGFEEGFSMGLDNLDALLAA